LAILAERQFRIYVILHVDPVKFSRTDYRNISSRI